MMKILYFDTETTGLDPVKNDIIQIAGIVEINNEVKEEFEMKCQPFSYENISQQALDIHGYSVDKLKEFQTPQEMYGKLLKIFNKYINKYNKFDKFIPGGQNVQFDVKFLIEFFKKNNNLYCMSYIDYHKLDLMALTMALHIFGKEKFDNFKLETAAKKWNIEINSHDALSDIKATRSAILKFKDYLK